MIFLKFKNVSPYGKMIDHVSGLDWERIGKKNLRSKKRYFQEITPPNILCASPGMSTLQENRFVWKTCVTRGVLNTIFMHTAYPTYRARCVCVHT